MKTATVTSTSPDGKTKIWIFNPSKRICFDLLAAEVLGVINHGTAVTIEPTPEKKESNHENNRIHPKI